jgi:hypothetical protein
VNYIKLYEDFISDRAVAIEPSEEELIDSDEAIIDSRGVIHIKNWNQY